MILLSYYSFLFFTLLFGWDSKRTDGSRSVNGDFTYLLRLLDIHYLYFIFPLAKTANTNIFYHSFICKHSRKLIKLPGMTLTKIYSLFKSKFNKINGARVKTIHNR